MSAEDYSALKLNERVGQITYYKSQDMQVLQMGEYSDDYWGASEPNKNYLIKALNDTINGEEVDIQGVFRYTMSRNTTGLKYPNVPGE